MKTVVVTGASGFLGRNLTTRLEEIPEVRVVAVLREDSSGTLRDKLAAADIVYHLAGSNRPTRPEEFYEVNEGLTVEVVRLLAEQGKNVPVVLSSSTQAALDNDYGRSKLGAEEALEGYAEEHGGTAIVYRLTNIFGKWSKPNYNSVVATFCHNIARDLPIEVHDPSSTLRLVYVDDVVQHFLTHLEEVDDPGVHRPRVGPEFDILVGELADRIRRFRSIRWTLRLPDLRDPLTRRLHATYVAALPEEDLAYPLNEQRDDRGKLAELAKSEAAGQIFVSTTRPGIIRGNHYHHTKVEKFCVLQGDGVIRFRRIGSAGVVEYAVSGDRWEVLDIPPGYTHNIENVGSEDLIVLFWASEIFDDDAPDTHYQEVME